jgi:hypothetical protein
VASKYRKNFEGLGNEYLNSALAVAIAHLVVDAASLEFCKEILQKKVIKDEDIEMLDLPSGVMEAVAIALVDYPHAQVAALSGMRIKVNAIDRLTSIAGEHAS